MYTLHEGEILLKETYGANTKSRIYLKPADQFNVAVVDNKNTDTALINWCAKIFLPHGYPHSVSKDYLAYQMWDTAQAFCSTITGTLATQEVLRGVGVGNTNATPLAATITWVIKDGCGHLARIVFAYSHGSQLDAYSKKWRLYADVLNDAAMCVEMALPLLKNYITLGLCVSTMMKAIVGVAGGASRIAMTQHHAMRGNLGDVTAKDSAQETAVNLIASMFAVVLIMVFGNSLLLFGLMLVLHIIFNYMAVRSVCLKTLNEIRFMQVIDTYLREEVVASPCQINSVEPLLYSRLGENVFDYKVCGFHIKMGQSIKSIISQYPKASKLRSLNDLYASRKYILHPNTHNRRMYISFKENATSDDMLCSYFHAAILSAIISAINGVHLDVYMAADEARPFVTLCQTLQSSVWTYSSKSVSELDDETSLQHEPTIELMQYVDEVVQKEWQIVQSLLLKTGWDLSKHLLLVDEWRITSPNLTILPSKLNTKEPEEPKVPSQIATFVDVDRSFVDEARDKGELDMESFTVEPEEPVVVEATSTTTTPPPTKTTSPSTKTRVS